ncbi:MAG TPA: M23 family metallopeptidase [Myxococcota bacterium]|jgi:murein DD-endopeptidase MepM/ murein hydrolase activator NlpD
MRLASFAPGLAVAALFAAASACAPDDIAAPVAAPVDGAVDADEATAPALATAPDVDDAAPVDAAPALLPGRDWLPPVVGIVTSGFGDREMGDFHDAVDLRAPIGTVVDAPTDLAIRTIGYGNKPGRYIIADAVDDGGKPTGWRFTFAHLSHVDVFDDQRVARGTAIALTGWSGAVTGPHLHFRVEKLDEHGNHTAVDPLTVMSPLLLTGQLTDR